MLQVSSGASHSSSPSEEDLRRSSTEKWEQHLVFMETTQWSLSQNVVDPLFHFFKYVEKIYLAT